MPLQETPKTRTPYSIIAFDKDGRERNDDPEGLNGLMSAHVLEAAGKDKPTDLFLFSHGWRGDMPAAIDQYNRWIDAVAALEIDRQKMGSDFKPLWIGIHWPSEPWGEEEIQADAFAAHAADLVEGVAAAPALDLKEAYLERLGLQGNDQAARQLEIIFQENMDDPAARSLSPKVQQAYDELSAMLAFGTDGPGSDPGEDHADFNAQDAFEAFDEDDAFGGGFLGGILAPLRVLSFWTMKRRALKVGGLGVYEFVAKLQNLLPHLRVHVMGHSFGCIVASSLCSGPDRKKALPRPIESLVLVQGAFSFWSYAAVIPPTKKMGFFAPLLERGAVSGPIVTTQSEHDLAVGKWYPRATSLVREAIEFAAPASGTPDYKSIIWGSVGTYGIQGTQKTDSFKMLPATEDYTFVKGHIANVESSEFIKKMVGASGAHSDIDGPEVAHLIWQAALVGNATA